MKLGWIWLDRFTSMGSSVSKTSTSSKSALNAAKKQALERVRVGAESLLSHCSEARHHRPGGRSVAQLLPFLLVWTNYYRPQGSRVWPARPCHQHPHPRLQSPRLRRSRMLCRWATRRTRRVATRVLHCQIMKHSA